MNNLCKQYMKDVQAFFPVMRKQEKEYLKKLENVIEDYCEDTDISTLEELYKEFGTPSEVLNSYCSIMDYDYLTKQIKRAKYIKFCGIAIIVILLISLIIHCIYLHNSYQLMLDSQPFFDETIIH